MDAGTTDTRLWDQFWQSGRQGCCSQLEGTANAARIRRTWTQFFDICAVGDRILDLCTGNGAVLELALAESRARGCSTELYGVDSAAILPGPASKNSREGDCSFVRASVTRLPFADESFNVLTSQFGIEYAPMVGAVSESMRTLKSGGRARFVTHADGGVTAEAAATELAGIAHLHEEIDIFNAAKNALTLVCNVERAPERSSSAQVDRARNAHEDFHKRLAAMAENLRQRAAMVVYRETGALLQHTYVNRQHFDLGVLLQKLHETEESVALHEERLRALIGAALDRDSCARLVAECSRLGATQGAFEPLDAADGASQLAWVITIEK